MTHQAIKYLLLLAILASSLNIKAQPIRELNKNNISMEYYEAIDWYQQLNDKYDEARLMEVGTTDIGKPLHLFVIDKEKTFSSSDLNRSNKRVLFINNGIHPGEPDGIDASLRFAMNLLENQEKIPDNTIICIVPVFNIGGALNRGCCSRANQNGPKEYGFRGNAQNLDLNRDFVKADASNTRSLIRAIRFWDPDIFIDTHVSNGADYQYTMTLLTTQLDKLGGVLTGYVRQHMLPALYDDMKNKGHEMTPYVNTLKYSDDPRKGMYDYIETPRYASGFCALFGIISFVTETHMLKPFPDRVDATEAFLTSALEYLEAHGDVIYSLRNEWKQDVLQKKSIPLRYVTDSIKFTNISFNGYESSTQISDVTGLPQLYYDNKRPYTSSIKYYNKCVAANKIEVPKQYIIPAAWNEVVAILTNAGVAVGQLERDVTLEVGINYITSYDTKSKPYEGHYLHFDVKSKNVLEKVKYYKGDYLVTTSQSAIRYIVETLEPEGEDSFFAWGFFDGVLQQKEWFSSYVFDGYASDLLKNNPQLKKEFNEMKNSDPKFASDTFSQLYYLYKKSPLFEQSLNRYPVGKIYK